MSTGAIAATLRELDRDRYLATLILREPHRAAIQALYAFGAEIAAIPARVSEPGPGEIRLQWWRDALEGQEIGAVAQNPVAAALLDAVRQYNLPAGPLVRLIAARRFDLYQDPMPDMETFEGYAGETASTLYQYAAMILNGGRPIADGDAAGHLGVAHALIGHMRAFGFNASRGRIFLPMTILSADGVTESEIFSGRSSEGLAEAFSQLASVAVEHLAKAQRAARDLPRDIRPAFAIRSVLGLELRLLQKSSANPFSPPDVPDWRKIVALMTRR